MDLRKESRKFRSRMNKYKLKDFEYAYNSLSEFLNYEFKMESKRTFFEKNLSSLIKDITKMEVLTSFWIGKRNYDFFFPRLTGNLHGIKQSTKVTTYKGLVVEVDGKVHDQYVKMKRDESKGEKLKELGLGMIVIENRHISDPVVESVLDGILKLKKLDHRAKKRLMRNIYIETLFAHKDLIRKEKLSPCESMVDHLFGR